MAGVLARKQEAFSHTIPADGQGLAQGSAAGPAPGAALPAGPAVELPGAELLPQLEGGQARARYRLQEALGVGASGEVYAIEDRNLSRVVAVKVQADGRADSLEIRHFVREAQIAASLQHPNVLPIYDLDRAADGRVYFTMPRISGRSLGSVIEQSAGASVDARIRHPSSIARIGIAIAQALAYAHHRQVIHQDVKPDNIMLGDFGEVLLLDWGSAIELEPGAKPQLYGTPLYMSPEQARGESVDQRSDIYCLGATLYHALLLRVPTWCDEPDRFWTEKRQGQVAWPDAAERDRHPAVLLDILRKCLAADPGQRYQGADALLEDLNGYLNGLAVSAHRESMLERLRRMHRLHARNLYVGVGVLALAAVLVGMVYGRQLEEMTHWGAPILVEDFASAPGPQWKVNSGGFRVQDGWLVTTGSHSNIILLDRRLRGSTAIEYDGECLPGSRPCDISLVWCKDRELSPDGQSVKSLNAAYFIQLGANDNSGVKIQRDQHTLTYSDQRLEVGRRYHVRVEIEDDRLALWIDGRLSCTWRDSFPVQDGYFGLYGFYPLKAFAHLRVYARSVAQRIPATGIGDAFVAKGDYASAEEAYAQVVESHPGTAIGEEALYRQGLCFWRTGKQDRAMELWNPLRRGQLAGEVRLHDLDLAFAHDDHEAVLSGIAEQFPAADAEYRHQLAYTWGRFAAELIDRDQRQLLVRYLELHDRLLMDEHGVDDTTAGAMLRVGRNQEILDRYPDLRFTCANALLALGRFEEIARDYPEQDWPNLDAAYESGKFDILGKYHVGFLDSRGLLYRGHFEEALTDPDSDGNNRARALMALGRLEQALQTADDHGLKAHCLLLMGRGAEVTDEEGYLRELAIGDAQKAMAMCPQGSDELVVARWRLALERWITGDRHVFDPLAWDPKGILDGGSYGISFYCWELRPFLEELAGEHGALSASCRQVLSSHALHFQQRPAADARWLLGSSDDRAFLAQPAPIFAEARLQLLKAMRADLGGDAVGAMAAYRMWQDMPLYQRGESPDPVLIRLVAWRLAQLAPAQVPPRS